MERVYPRANCNVAGTRRSARARDRRGLDGSIQDAALAFAVVGGDVCIGARTDTVEAGAAVPGIEELGEELGDGKSDRMVAVTGTKTSEVTVEGGRVVVVFDRATQHSPV